MGYDRSSYVRSLMYSCDYRSIYGSSFCREKKSFIGIILKGSQPLSVESFIRLILPPKLTEFLGEDLISMLEVYDHYHYDSGVQFNLLSCEIGGDIVESFFLTKEQPE